MRFDVSFKCILAILISASVIAYADLASAQQRTFVNGSFEANDPRGPGNPSFQIFNDNVVIEWTDDTGFIELWDDGFQNVPSFDGDVHAELNAHASGTLFQNICLVNGETLGWSFAHRARVQGQNTQTVLFEVADNSGVLIQSLASQSSNINGGWNVNANSVTYTGPTGVQRARFRTTDPGSVGNFLDNLQFDIPAFAQITSANVGDLEASGGNIPAIQVFGRVDSITAIPINVTGGTADNADYNLSATSISIPIGIYSGCLLYTSPSPRDRQKSRMPSSA